ncbi:Pyridoxamine kinase, partial [Pseudomonas cannabina pv. alisalensis]
MRHLYFSLLHLHRVQDSTPMKRTPHLLAIQSHVVFGHAGNSAAVFPMQRIGVNVWPRYRLIPK